MSYSCCFYHLIDLSFCWVICFCFILLIRRHSIWKLILSTEKFLYYLLETMFKRLSKIGQISFIGLLPIKEHKKPNQNLLIRHYFERSFIFAEICFLSIFTTLEVSACSLQATSQLQKLLHFCKIFYFDGCSLERDSCNVFETNDD